MTTARLVRSVNLEASCANCASFSAGACGRGLAPLPGEPRCDSYQISDAFASDLASRVLAESPMRVLVPLRPLTSAQRETQRKQAKAPPRKGFRAR